MPKEPPKVGDPRQRPVSCRFCRMRKLRCSREAPCSNCVSRGLECDLVQAAHNGSQADDADKAELLERIRKLEALVEHNTRLTSAGVTSHGIPPTTTPLVNVLPSHTIGESRGATTESSQASVASPSEQLDHDFAWLESIYDGSECAVSARRQCHWRMRGLANSL